MPTQDELFEEFGRPEAYPPGKALIALGAPDNVNPGVVQAFFYYSQDMAVAFTNGGRSEPGRRFLGMCEADGGWVAAFEMTQGTGAEFNDQQISPARFSAQLWGATTGTCPAGTTTRAGRRARSATMTRPPRRSWPGSRGWQPSWRPGRRGTRTGAMSAGGDGGGERAGLLVLR